MARSRPPLLEGSRFAFLMALASALTCGWLIWSERLTLPWALLLHLLLTSLLTFGVFALDKRRAKSGARRVSEANLLWLSALGGAGGAWLAMRRLRHKTQKNVFRFVVPTLAFLLGALLVWTFYGELSA